MKFDRTPAWAIRHRMRSGSSLFQPTKRRPSSRYRWSKETRQVKFIKRLKVAVILAIIAVSLYMSSMFIQSHPAGVFFLLPFRMFEFLIGALCVFVSPIKYRTWIMREMCSAVGLLIIIFTSISFSEETVFPGYSALIPCIGAALIITSSKSKISGYILGNKISVKIGLISYSIYLAHWPLFVYYKYWKFEEITNIETIVIIILSFVIGYFMWKFIESPFRHKKEDKSDNNPLGTSINRRERPECKADGAQNPRYIMGIGEGSSTAQRSNPGVQQVKRCAPFINALLVAICLSFISLFILENNGFPSRFPNEYFMTKDDINANRSRYWQHSYSEKILGGKNGNESVLVMGNSHANDLLYMLRENGYESKVYFLTTSHECYNFGSPVIEKFESTCAATLRRNMASDYWGTVGAVYLHDHWPILDMKDLGKRIKEIRSITRAPIYVFGPKMTYTKSVPKIVSSHMRINSVNEFSENFQVKSRVIINDEVRETLSNLDVEGVYFIDLLRVQCGDDIGKCDIISPINSKFLYFDDSHFTLQGARESGERLKIKYPEVFIKHHTERWPRKSEQPG